MKLKLDGKFLACQIVSVALLVSITTTAFAKGIKSKEDLGLALQNAILCKGYFSTTFVDHLEDDGTTNQKGPLADNTLRKASSNSQDIKDLLRLGVKASRWDTSVGFLLLELDPPPGTRVWGYEVEKIHIGWGGDGGSGDGGWNNFFVTIHATAADLGILKNMLRLKPVPKLGIWRGEDGQDGGIDDEQRFSSIRYSRAVSPRYDAVAAIVLGVPKVTDGTQVVMGCRESDSSDSYD